MTGRGGRRRTWVIVAVATAIVAIVAVRALWPRDHATAVAVDDAVDRYRASTTIAAGDDATGASGPITDPAAGPSAEPATEPSTEPATVEPTTAASTVPAAPSLPAPGVYRFHTVGAESVDILGGATHKFPEETVLTITAEGCGVLLRWDLLAERREEWRLCTAPDGIEYQSTATAYHEFFDNGRTELAECDRTVLVVPADGAPRPPIDVTCLLDGRPWNPRWEVLGPDTVDTPAGERTATHVRMIVTTDGTHYEHTVVEWWLDEHGLPLRMTTSKESNTDSGVIGDVLYTEQYLAELVSATPLT